MQECDGQQKMTPEAPGTTDNISDEMSMPWAIGSRRWFEFSLLAALSLLAVLVYYYPILGNGFRASSDGQFSQYFERFVGWSDLYLGGWPSYADPNSMPLYPIKYILPATPLGFKLFVISAYFIYSLGNGALAAFITNSRPAAVFAAVTSPAIGFFVAHQGHTSMIHAAAYLPWMILGGLMLRSSNAQTFFGISLLSIAVAFSFLAGHPQVSIYGLFGCGLLMLLASFRNPNWIGDITKWCLAVGLGLGLAAAFLLPAYGFTKETMRASIDAQTLRQFSLRLYEIGLNVFPYVAGGGWWSGAFKPYVAGGPASSWEENISYLGVSLSIIVMIGWRSILANTVTRSFAILGAVSILLAMAPAITLIAQVLVHVPVLSMFRAWARWQLVSSLVVVQLAAFVIHTTLKTGALNMGKRHIIGFCLLLIFIAFSINFCESCGKAFGLLNLLSEASGIQLLFLMALALLFSVNTRALGRVKQLVLFVLILGVTSTELYLLSRQAAWFNARTPAVNELSDEIRGQVRELLGNGEGGRLLTLTGWQSRHLDPDGVKAMGLPSVNWYGPLLNKRAAEMLGTTSGGWTRPDVLSSKNQILDIYGVVAVEPYWPDATPNNLSREEQYPPDRWKEIPTKNPVGLLQNIRALPRLRFVLEGQNVSDEQALTALRTSEMPDGSVYSARETALLSSDARSFSSRTAILPEIFAVAIEGNDILVSLTKPSTVETMLVLGDNHSNSWRASIDGKPENVVRVNYNQIGLYVPPESSKIRLYYVDQLQTAGRIVSIASLAILVLWTLFHYQNLFKRHEARGIFYVK